MSTSALIFAIISTITTIIALTWGIVKFLLGRIEGVRKENVTANSSLKSEYVQKFDNIEKRMINMSETFARREDLREHAERIETGISNINSRLDTFFNLIVKNHNKE